MILSFSIPEMLPMIRAGLCQRAGEDMGSSRVKRQTIRRRGPQAERLLRHGGPCAVLIQPPYELQLWWKQRTKERERLGVLQPGYWRVYPVTIEHVNATHGMLRMEGPKGWRAGDAVISWDKTYGGSALEREARADGFPSVAAMRDYFVPNAGDRFDGILYRW